MYKYTSPNYGKRVKTHALKLNPGSKHSNELKYINLLIFLNKLLAST